MGSTGAALLITENWISSCHGHCSDTWAYFTQFKSSQPQSQRPELVFTDSTEWDKREQEVFCD